MISFFARYGDALFFPVGVILAAIAIGVLIERLIGRFIYRAFEKRNWKIGRRLIRSFNGIITLWFGLTAFRAEISSLPLKSSAVPVALKIETALFILSLAIFFGRVVVAFVRTYSSQHERNVASISLIENIIRGVIFVFGLLAIFRTFGVAVTPLLTALGVGGLAVALALQDTLSNFFAGIYIILSRSLAAGDYIKLASGEEGSILDIAWRVTSLKTSADTLIIVPNNKFATSIITNYDRPDKFTDLVIPFTLEATANLDEFEKNALEIGEEVRTSVPGVMDVKPVFELVAIANTGITVHLRLRISDYYHLSRIRHEVLKRIYDRSHTIALPKAEAETGITPKVKDDGIEAAKEQEKKPEEKKSEENVEEQS